MDRRPLNSKAAILVVEDEALTRLWAADLIEENGFSVLEAKYADAALKVLRTNLELPRYGIKCDLSS
jgi:CheY-like chemotaxis protein